jgi:ABC-type nitrate/sulfonate/bicarbonate transport system substrate-binding protein
MLSVAYVPLVDAAPLIVAHELGFAAEEGLSLNLLRAPSWSMVRDMLAFGQVEAAHMLSALPVAAALGLGGSTGALSAVAVLSVNGNVIGVTAELADRMRAQGHDFGFDDAHSAGRALIAAVKGSLRIGVPFPFSMHSELLIYWLSALGFPAPQKVDVRTVPPPQMAEAIGAREIDAFCVGEPWGSLAVEQGVGTFVLPGSAIWSFSPEKVLAVRDDWAAQNPVLCAKLIPAVWRAGRWLADPNSHTVASEILGRAEYLDQPTELLDRALTGRMTISPMGEHRTVSGFVEFHNGAANFPWQSQAEWIGLQLAACMGLDRHRAQAAAGRVFRSDIYRAAIQMSEADLPGASSKLEGSIAVETPVASALGRLTLLPDQFFDRRVFDPSKPE